MIVKLDLLLDSWWALAVVATKLGASQSQSVVCKVPHGVAVVDDHQPKVKSARDAK